MLSDQASNFGRGYARWCARGKGAFRLHFAAANGFPVKAYRSFLAGLAPDFPLAALENRGLWRGAGEPPAAFDWCGHRDDLIGFLDFLSGRGLAAGPIVGVGHSIGATVTLLAALARPDLFSGLVLIDPATRPQAAASTAVATLVARTRARRNGWSSPQAFRDYLVTKSVYRHFAGQALDDYVASGLEEVAAGEWRLRYSVAWEAHNFAHTPAIAAELTCVALPTLLIYGEYSPMRLSPVRSDHLVTEMIVPGAGHLLPLEMPSVLLGGIAPWLGRLAKGRSQAP